MGVMLLLQSEGRPGRAIPVMEPEFVIGRDPSCHLRLEQDTISSRHCRIRLDGDRVWVEDLNSRNGTIVNEHSVRTTEVHHGDLLRLGSSQFLFSIGRPGEAAPGSLPRGPVRVRLVVESGKVKGQSIEVHDAIFTIGRDPSCQLRPNNPTISRKHACIERREGRVFVRDLGTTNGTILNDRILRGEEMEGLDGDRVQLGPLVFTLAIESAGFDGSGVPAANPTGSQLIEPTAAPEDPTAEILSTLLTSPASPTAPDAPTMKTETPTKAEKPTAPSKPEEKPSSSGEIRPVEDGMLRLPQIKLGLLDDVLIVAVQSPYLDETEATVGPVRYGLAATLEHGYPTRVVIDLEQVGSISRRAAGMFMAHAQRLYRAKGKLRLCRVSEQVRNELETMSGSFALEIFDELNEAIRSPW